MDFPHPAPWQESGRSRSPRPGTDWSDVPLCPAVPFDQLTTAPAKGSASSVRPHGRKTSRRRRRVTSRRDLRVAGIFGLGAASGLLLATWLLLFHNAEPAASPSPPSGHMEAPLPTSPAPKDPPPPTPGQPDRPQPGAPDPPLPEIPGTGVLRQGDSGHGVYELQVRLQQIPGIYDGGAIDGRYGAEVRAAVTLFQKRYGVRGDESGVYGANTRLALMLRTK
ncbi:peptidoglycan-binding protein [Streptomyces sp. NPDC052301]|uniref:peptidoglycan-binding protein n=1 Tax=Streptomyces sp. NPDC052301 TaxID=3365687 RepID=UPI0037D49966